MVAFVVVSLCRCMQARRNAGAVRWPKDRFGGSHAEPEDLQLLHISQKIDMQWLQKPLKATGSEIPDESSPRLLSERWRHSAWRDKVREARGWGSRAGLFVAESNFTCQLFRRACESLGCGISVES